jgi:hypothetical protein
MLMFVRLFTILGPCDRKNAISRPEMTESAPALAGDTKSADSHDASVSRRGSASHLRDKVYRKILIMKSAAFFKNIGNGTG